MTRRLSAVAMGLAATAALSGPALAQVSNKSAPPGGAAVTGAEADRIDGKGGCFYINQTQGDHALGDRSVLFRVNVSDIYRLDFAQQCAELTFPEPKLILTPAGGQGLICRAIDLDVKVGEQSPGSFPVSCIPSALYKLTAAQVAAIPKKDLP